MSETEAESPTYEPGVAILAIAPWLFPAGAEPWLGLAGTLAIGAGSLAYADVAAHSEPSLGGRVMALVTPLLALYAIALMLTPGSLVAGFVLALVASAPRLIRSWQAAGHPRRTWALFAIAVAVGAAYAHGVQLLRVTPFNLRE